MAQQLENPLRYRAGENNGFEKAQKGKVMAAQGTRRARAALGQIENNIGISKDMLNGKGGKASRAVSQVQIAHKNVAEASSNKVEERPRTCSVEPMETDRELSLLKEVDMRQVTDIDADDYDNPFMAAEYANEIYAYLKKREAQYQVPADYMEFQLQINERMRAILVDWLVQVHDKFRLLQETLFLTVSVLDRYLAADCKVNKGNLQLVGVTAMLLASKIEEMFTPEIGDFVYITDNAYTAAMIRSLESKMATLLNYNFGDPLCIHFLRRNSKAAKADAEKHTLAKYFMELMLPDYTSIRFPPSQRAAASLCLATKITDNSPWDATVTHYSGYSEPSLRPCMKRIAQLVLKSGNKQSKLLSVTNKYNRSKFYKIASSPCLSSQYLITLAQE